MKDDATDKSKKTLPRRDTDQATPLINAEQYDVLFNSVPSLPTKRDQERPCLLLVDDDPDFLAHIQQNWQKHYRNAFELITRHSAEGNIVGWIEQRLQSSQRLDALFLDKHLGEGGASTKDYLEQLRENTATEYLPAIVVTTSEFGTDEKDRREFLQYAQWILYRKEATPAFLYQMATSLPSALDAAEDRMWASLISAVASWIAEQKIDEEQSAEQLAKQLYEGMNTFFSRCLNLCGYFLRLFTDDGLTLVEPAHPLSKDFPATLKEQDFPAFELLGNQPVKIDALEPKHVGRYTELLGKPFLGYRLAYAGQKLGTLTLYRKPGQPPFRDKDTDFLEHLGLQLSNFLGWGRQAQRDRRRLKSVAAFADSAALQTDVDVLLLDLAKLLHREVNHDRNAEAKTTIRKLDRASGKIFRVRHLGLYAQPAVLHLDDQSTYASALRERLTLRGDPKEIHGGYYETSKNVKSCLTVPIMSGNRVFGGVNLEHLQTDQYTVNDEQFVRTLCDLAGAAMIRLKQFIFHQHLTRLMQSLWDGKDFTVLQREIYQTLQRFTGFALLLHLLPDRTNETGWKIEHVVDSDDDDIRIYPEKYANEWRHSIFSQWSQTFICKVLSEAVPKFAYVDGKDAIPYQLETGLQASGRAMVAYSESVIPIHYQEQTRSAIVLLFRLDKALTQEQQHLLQDFGQLTGEMLQHIEDGLDLETRLQTAQVEAQLGFLYGQLRHVLNNQYGGIGNLLNELEDEGGDAWKLATIRTSLAQLNTHLQNMRYLVQEPRFEAVDIVYLWNGLQPDFSEISSYSAQLTFGEQGCATIHSDKAILSSILYNLVLNAAQACKKAAISPCIVTLSSRQERDAIYLRVCDNGPGLGEAQLERVFEKGFTTRSDGTGFGLYFCRFQAERLNAKLSAKPNDNGACFELSWNEEVA